MCPGSGPWSLSYPTTFPASTLPPSGNPYHASPETLSGVCRHDLNHDYRNHSALQSASREPENRAEKRGDSHCFWFFWRRIIFCREMGRRERIWFSTAMNRRAMISADKFNEPAPRLALRPYRCITSTITKVAT